MPNGIIFCAAKFIVHRQRRKNSNRWPKDAFFAVHLALEIRSSGSLLSGFYSDHQTAIDLLAVQQKSLDRALFFIQSYTRSSIEWCWSFYHCCAHSKILQNSSKCRSIHMLCLFRIARGLLVSSDPQLQI